MQKLNLQQSLSQKLSPQQIQFIKLLQIPTVELEARVEAELESNPALEEGRDESNDEKDEFSSEEDLGSEEYENDSVEDINVEDYVSKDDISGYKMQGDGPSPDEEDRDMPIATVSSLTESLHSQLSYLNLSDRENVIGEQLIGSIDNDGYIRRELEAIVNDLAFAQNVEATLGEVEAILKKVQLFDPPGIAARDLQECLTLQIKRKDLNIPLNKNALKVVMLCFEEFKKKHFTKIQKKLGITEDALKDAVQIIIKLNPKPGGFSTTYSRNQYIIPDFILKEVNGDLEVRLNSKNAPELHVSR